MESPSGPLLEPFEDVRASSKRRQREDGDILKPDYVSNAHEEVKLSYQQNDLSDLQHVWANWDDDERGSFVKRYGDIALLLQVRIDVNMLRAAA